MTTRREVIPLSSAVASGRTVLRPGIAAHVAHQLPARRQAELAEDAVDVVLDGGFAEAKLARDFLVRQRAADELRDLVFAPRERRCRLRDRHRAVAKRPRMIAAAIS